ncbi:MAG: ABC transporter substrate-binding protein [Dehalococcoidia bacterium]|nr:ABC transporter substrate-binding protein [Dehalococcoidia bacterium]
MTPIGNYWERTLGRRTVLRSAGLVGAGLAGAALIGCGGDDDPTATSTPGGAGVTATGTPAPADSVPQGGKVSIGYYAEADKGLSPRTSDAASYMGYMELIGDTYVYLGGDGRSGDARHALWEEIEYPEPTTLVAKIREGVKFHDGTDFTAESVKAHLEFLMDPEKAPDFRYATSLAAIESIDVPGDGTVRLNLSAPDSTLLFTLGTNPGMPFSLAQVEALGNDEIVKPALTGPYMVDTWRDGGAVFNFVRNPNYWGTSGYPYLDSIDYQILRQGEARAAALESGQVDIIGFEEGTATSARLQQDSRWQYQAVPVGPANTFLNHFKAPLDDIRVRQALAHASDRERVLQTIYVGQGSVATSHLPTGGQGWSDYEPYPYNPDEARKLLAAAGYEDSKPVLSAEITGLPPKQEDVNQMSLLKEMYDSIGFDIEIANVSDATAFRRENRGNIRIGSTSVRHPVLMYEIFFSTSGSFNAGHDSREPEQLRIDDLVSQGKLATEDELEGILDELHRITRDEVYGAIPLVTRIKPVFANDKVGNFDTPEFIAPMIGGTFRPRTVYRMDA